MKFLLLLLLSFNLLAGENSFDRAMPIGSVVTMATQSCPQGYLAGDGKSYLKSAYPKLASAIGVIYGGDSTNFNVPDYRAQIMRGNMPLSSLTGSGTVATNNATFTNHNINRTGMKVRLMSGTLSGLSTSTDYYAIVVNTNTVAFATSRVNAFAGTKVAISGANSGVIQQFEDPNTTTRLLQNGATSFAVGSMQEDSFQGHWHDIYADNGQHSGNTVGGGSANEAGVGIVGNTYRFYARDIFSDGTNGTPRTSSESRPRNIYVLYCIKY